jgi:hypothetical protein
MLAEFRRRFKRARATPLRIRKSDASGVPQRLQTCFCLSLFVLDKPQPFAQDFARILISTRGHKALHEIRLILGQYDVSGGHFRYIREKVSLA